MLQLYYNIINFFTFCENIEAMKAEKRGTMAKNKEALLKNKHLTQKILQGI